ncbi:MAG: hypothetical protein ACREXY_16190, partial [Gammaproteobacteria bacterium]
MVALVAGNCAYPCSGIPMTVHAQDRHFTQGVGGVRGNIRTLVDLPDGHRLCGTFARLPSARWKASLALTANLPEV